MYESFFNLKKKPFELVPDPDFIYLSRSHKKALTYLDYGIRERAGFILLTGEVGSGKTTLIRDLLKKKYEKVVLAKVFNTRASSDQLLAMINDDFGLPVAGKDKITLMRELNDFLLEQYAQGKQPILIIDEAQNLAPDLLEEIRMLSNLESSHRKLLQIMLVGQPELRATLSAPGLMQLRQRISINCHLKALSREETAEYIAHRMEVAGNPGALELPEETLDVIHKCSRGIPRLINIICDFLMLSAFAEEVRSVPVDMVRDVIGDLDFESHYWGGESEILSKEPPSVQEEPASARESLPDLSGFTVQLQNSLKDISESVAKLQDDLNTRMAKCETLVSELSGRVAPAAETFRGDPESGAALGGVSFMRRLFGGVNSHGT